MTQYSLSHENSGNEVGSRNTPEVGYIQWIISLFLAILRRVVPLEIFN